jgi:hypothetical protein
MNIPPRNVWMRYGYTLLGGVSAYAWKKSFKGEVRGGVLIPPAAMSALIAFSKDTGETEKDIASATLGFLVTTQVLSWTHNTEPRQNPSTDLEKINKVREVTNVLGAVVDVVSKLKGSNT